MVRPASRPRELSAARLLDGNALRLSLEGMTTTRLRVQLRDVEPAVVRVLDVPASATLTEVHLLLQAALGWTDTHLHEFEADGRTYALDEDDDDVLDEQDVPLSALGGRFVYLYDFGDGWEHDVDVFGDGGVDPGVVSGEGTCPPEDCGGPSGYDELRVALDDPSHPEHRDYLDWCGPLNPFDLAAANEALRIVARSLAR
jgi:hypothetical protein